MIAGLKHQRLLLLDKVSNDRSISSLSQPYNYYIITYKTPLLYNTSLEHGKLGSLLLGKITIAVIVLAKSPVWIDCSFVAIKVLLTKTIITLIRYSNINM
jgi:hypothetical protein